MCWRVVTEWQLMWKKKSQICKALEKLSSNEESEGLCLPDAHLVTRVKFTLGLFYDADFWNGLPYFCYPVYGEQTQALKCPNQQQDCVFRCHNSGHI